MPRFPAYVSVLRVNPDPIINPNAIHVGVTSFDEPFGSAENVTQESITLVRRPLILQKIMHQTIPAAASLWPDDGTPLNSLGSAVVAVGANTLTLQTNALGTGSPPPISPLDLFIVIMQSAVSGCEGQIRQIIASTDTGGWDNVSLRRVKVNANWSPQPAVGDVYRLCKRSLRDSRLIMTAEYHSNADTLDVLPVFFDYAIAPSPTVAFGNPGDGILRRPYVYQDITSITLPNSGIINMPDSTGYFKSTLKTAEASGSCLYKIMVSSPPSDLSNLYVGTA